MYILITGASGFIGQILTRHLLTTTDHTLVLTDLTTPPIPPDIPNPQNAQALSADLCSPTSTTTLLSTATSHGTRRLDAIYILHGIMSSGSESNFPLGMAVNIDSTRLLLDTLRSHHPHGAPVRIIYASSLAVYGPPFPLPSTPLTESHRPTPSSSYGAQKLITETLLNDLSRRGLIDAHILRFPTVAIRPGAPTAAASSFVSGIIREPLRGRECVVPVVERGLRSWLCSPRTLVANLGHALRVPAGSLAGWDRVVNLPGTGVSVQEMRDVLEKVGGRERLGLVSEVEDEATGRILRSWATEFDCTRALGLGYVPDAGFESAVREYVESLG